MKNRSNRCRAGSRIVAVMSLVIIGFLNTGAFSLSFPDSFGGFFSAIPRISSGFKTISDSHLFPALFRKPSDSCQRHASSTPHPSVEQMINAKWYAYRAVAVSS